jgi:hypothetical protein
LGCILYELVFREKAFKGNWELLRFACSRQQFCFPPKSPESIDDISFALLSEIIVTCLDQVHSNRPSAKDLWRIFNNHANPNSSLNGSNDTQVQSLVITAEAFHSEPTVSGPNRLVSPTVTPASNRVVVSSFRSTNRRSRRRTQTYNRNPFYGRNYRGSDYVHTGRDSYYYRNPDGSYHYKNPDGSRFTQWPNGDRQLILPDGTMVC